MVRSSQERKSSREFLGFALQSSVFDEVSGEGFDFALVREIQNSIDYEGTPNLMKKRWCELTVCLLAIAAGCAERALPLPDPNGIDGPPQMDMAQVDMAGDEDDATLLDLVISQGMLSPTFAPLLTSYTATEPHFVEMVMLTPTAKSPKATISVNGQPVLSGMASQMIPLSVGMNPVTVAVATPMGKMQRYNVIVTRASSSIEYLKASNTGGSDCFGMAVALSGDTLVVGAPNEPSNATGVGDDQNNNNAPGSGAVYVFTQLGGVWRQQAYLKASNTIINISGFPGIPSVLGTPGGFGGSVALSGDTLAVGAPAESSNATGVGGDQNNNNAPESGAVYVFTRSGGVWKQEAYLKASNTGARDGFGWSVALDGNTLAVGAPREDSNATGVDGDQNDDPAPFNETGAVYVFTRSVTTWSQQAYLKSNHGRPSIVLGNNEFGVSVSLSGDTLAVGAVDESNPTLQSGGAYVFTRSGTTWTEQARLAAPSPNFAAGFGVSVSLSDDTLAVGRREAVYVFTRSGIIWTQQASLKASNIGAADNFGFAVSLSGDTLAVGAFNEGSSATGVDGNPNGHNLDHSGAVFLFTRSGTTWTQRAYLKASNTGEGDQFGASVSVSGGTLAVGAPGEASNATGVDGNQTDNSAQESGAVYVY
jgi:hypothetical protein